MSERAIRENENQANRLWSGRFLAQIALSMMVGALLMLGAMSLANRARPAPIVIVPPPPTPTPAPTATPGPVRVYVNGAVARPDIYELPPDGLVREALAAAGGVTAEGEAAGVNLAQPLYDGLQVYVPLKGEEVEIRPAAAGGDVPQIVDLNRATPAQLETLPGIGPSMAARIVAYRAEHGPFESVEGLLDVSGIGPAKFEGLKGLVVVGD